MLALALVLSFGMGIILGMVGGGGSILTLPILLYVLGVDERTAITTSLAVVGLTSLAALIPHARKGNVDFRTGLIFAAAGAAGAFGGGAAAAHIPPRWLLLGFITTMIAAGLAMIRGRRAREEEAPKARAPLWRILGVGLGAGALTGLVGAGGGFIVVPALALFGGLDMRRAVGTSLLVITVNTAFGFLGHNMGGAIDLPVTAAMTVAAVLGSALGSAWSRLLPPAVLRRGFGVLVMVMAVIMGFKEL